jgi:hypothetical protein
MPAIVIQVQVHQDKNVSRALVLYLGCFCPHRIFGNLASIFACNNWDMPLNILLWLNIPEGTVQPYNKDYLA